MVADIAAIAPLTCSNPKGPSAFEHGEVCNVLCIGMTTPLAELSFCFLKPMAYLLDKADFRRGDLACQATGVHRTID